MLRDLTQYLSLPEDTFNVNNAIFLNKLADEIEKEDNLFKLISLYGLKNILQIMNICPGLKYFSSINLICTLFEKYYFNNIKTEELKIINEILNNRIKETLIYKLLESFNLKDEEKKLFLIYYIININKDSFIIFLLLCLLKNNVYIVVEFCDMSFLDSPNILKVFYDNVIKNIKLEELNKNKVITIKFISNNILFEISKNENINKDNNINDFDIIIHEKNGDKIMNIKTYLNKFEYKKMDEISDHFKSIEKKLEIISTDNEKYKLENEKYKLEFEKQKLEIEKYKIEKEKQNSKINELNKKVNELIKEKNRYDDLRGRFIFKGFCDYILLLFDININLKYKEKKKLISHQKKINKNYFNFILSTINFMQSLYYQQTEESHYIPTNQEIKVIILNKYDEEDDSFIFEIFKQIKPENIIRKIIIKNNELTKLLISDINNEEKELKKNQIITEMNNLLTTSEKEKYLEILNKIIENYLNY